jgi:hypothetical protein
VVIIVESANNEDENGLLTCSECGLSGYQTMVKHLRRKHNMSPTEYLEKHPNDKVYTDEMQKKFSKGGYAANQAMRDKNLDFSERSRKARATELANDPDAYLKRNRKLYQDPDFKERATQRIMSVTNVHGARYDYNGSSLRSSWEVKFAQWLDSEDIKYEYETVRITYYDPHHKRNRYYYPDFYLPDYNMCVEVKPLCYVDDVTVQAKANATKNSGYNFIFITQKELSNLSTKLFNV